MSIVNIESGAEAQQRMDSGVARRSTPASRFLENEISVSKRFLHHSGYCRTIYNPRNMQPTLGFMNG